MTQTDNPTLIAGDETTIESSVKADSASRQDQNFPHTGGGTMNGARIDSQHCVEAAQAVLETESRALIALSSALNGDFVRAVETLLNVGGRVIVTGMGKSGHVARKIAATFASTGTPAHFVHPGEASHGDLGMITGSDAVLALSNSGETNELSDLIDYTRRFGIPLLSISSREQSTLASTSDVALVLPDQPEACPMGLAPTTSTTMMLGLGDALAVALMSARGFSASDFSVFHPGGKLGRRLLKVDALMHSAKSLPLVSVDALMSETIVEISRRSFGCVGVVDANGDLAGIITDGDLRRHMGSGLLEMRADEVMTPGPKTIVANALAAEALNIMNANAITCLFVLADGKPIGIVHIHDCLRAGIA